MSRELSPDRIEALRCEAMVRPSGIPCHGWEGPCDSLDAIHRRQNTQYCDDTRNWATLCDECQKSSNAYWADMWADYYANCM